MANQPQIITDSRSFKPKNESVYSAFWSRFGNNMIIRFRCHHNPSILRWQDILPSGFEAEIPKESVHPYEFMRPEVGQVCLRAGDLITLTVPIKGWTCNVLVHYKTPVSSISEDEGYDLITSIITAARAGKPYEYELHKLKFFIEKFPAIKEMVQHLSDNLEKFNKPANKRRKK